MAYKIAGVHDFEGPFISAYSLKEEPGIYIVLDLQDDGYHMIDAGVSENTRAGIIEHDRKGCWERVRTGALHYAAWYGEGPGIEKMERIVMENYDIPCLEG